MNKRNILGVDIGGTKCAITLGLSDGPDSIEIADKESFATTDCKSTIDNIIASIRTVLSRNSLCSGDIYSIGISCGGPLDSATGVVMSPPNLPGWDNIPIVRILSEEFGVKAAIHNDANACGTIRILVTMIRMTIAQMISRKISPPLLMKAKAASAASEFDIRSTSVFLNYG